MTDILPSSTFLYHIFSETPLFSESARFLSDDELRIAQLAIVANPRAGPAIRETNGARKRRVLLAYDKTVADDITRARRRALAALIDAAKDSPCLANPATQRFTPRLTT